MFPICNCICLRAKQRPTLTACADVRTANTTVSAYKRPSTELECSATSTTLCADEMPGTERGYSAT
eukprot:3173862-Rhodomonas_salina.1